MIVFRLLAAILLFGGSLGISVLSARAQDSGIAIGDTVSTDEEGVNLRARAGTDGDITTTLSQSVTMKVTAGPKTANGYTWWQVEVTDDSSVDDGVSGWVAEDYLILSDVTSPPDDSTNTPTPTATDTSKTPTPTSTPDDSADFDTAGWVQVADGPLNLRSKPSTDGAIVDTLLVGTSATVSKSSKLTDGSGYTWINVVTENGIKGWLATDFLTPLTSDPCPDNDCAQTGGSDDLTSAPSVEVTDGPVNLRSAASLSGDVLAVASTGTLLAVSNSPSTTDADGYTWLSIDVQGTQGWVATDFVAASDQTCATSPCDPNSSNDDSDPFAIAQGIKVTDGPVNVRAEAGLDGAITGSLQTGDTAVVDSRSALETVDGYTWIKVGAETGGWVATDFLTPLAEAPCDKDGCAPADLAPFIVASAAVVTDGPLNLRAAPDTNSASLMTLKEGDYLWIVSAGDPDPYLADGYFWIQVWVGGQTGYVAIDFVSVAD